MNPYPCVMSVTPRPPVTMVKGQGSWLYDADGRAYLDFIQGWAVNTLGHAPAVVAEALKAQATRLLNAGPAFFNGPMIELADRLCRLSGLDQVCFANSGAETNEAAIKLARKYGQHRGAFQIITTHNSFHGRTLAAMSASGKPQWEPLFEPKVPGFVKVPFDDVEAIEREINERTVAVMVEPIQGEGGVIVPGADYLRRLRELTERYGLLLILDEIQTGVGRTGTMFAFQQFGIRPDIVTLAKGLGGGVPIGAMLARKEVCCFEAGDQGGTFAGNALNSAVACAVLDEVSQPGFLNRVRETGHYLQSRLERLAQEHRLGGVRGRGLLCAIETPAGNSIEIQAEAFAAGLLLNAPRPHCLRLMPALNVTVDEIDEMALRLGRVLEAQRALA